MRWLGIMLLTLCGLLHAAEIGPAGYAPVTRGQPLRFPVDEGSHPEFRTEWWYLTGWLNVADEAKPDKDGSAGNSQPLGFQITFFRSRPNAIGDNVSGNPSAFAPRQLLFAHAAISDAKVGHLQHDERAARAGFGLAEAEKGSAEIWIDDWSLRRNEQGYRAEIPADRFQLSLQFEKTQPPLIQGDQGYSRKGPAAAHASYYYSMPQLKVNGTIKRNGKIETVNGAAWLDHEWSSTYLAEGAVGWDWTAINLDDGGAFMAFRIRDADGASVWAGGSYRSPPSARAGAGLGGLDSDSLRVAPTPLAGEGWGGEAGEGWGGETRIFRRDEISFTPLRTWRSPRTATEYPVVMRVQAGELDFTLAPLFDDQEFDARASTRTIYWEGGVRATQNGKPVGRGYLELTGYWRKLDL